MSGWAHPIAKLRCARPILRAHTRRHPGLLASTSSKCTGAMPKMPMTAGLLRGRLDAVVMRRVCDAPNEASGGHRHHMLLAVVANRRGVSLFSAVGLRGAAGRFAVLSKLQSPLQMIFDFRRGLPDELLEVGIAAVLHDSTCLALAGVNERESTYRRPPRSGETGYPWSSYWELLLTLALLSESMSFTVPRQIFLRSRAPGDMWVRSLGCLIEFEAKCSSDTCTISRIGFGAIGDVA